MHASKIIFAIAFFVAGIVGVKATDQPPCTSVPQAFWDCCSNCLYNVCPGDAACSTACQDACKAQYVPDCDPGPY
ncbi:hypothetical protein B0T19DRAFT_200623 [Cercophora scortea]|uniref:Uncharacterized protein n=1 Tax=Cercophora scortea TaxID=314031 RepID=A0AAE0M9A4_9PEZI|nr:hypothetical protein B0T19DRAFT_200623 [Cercophora scortea]